MDTRPFWSCVASKSRNLVKFPNERSRGGQSLLDMGRFSEVINYGAWGFAIVRGVLHLREGLNNLIPAWIVSWCRRVD